MSITLEATETTYADSPTFAEDEDFDDATMPFRSYDRSWEEIEDMLDAAEQLREEWHAYFVECRSDGERDGMMEAVRNFKALEGVCRSLRWVLGEDGAADPLA